MEAEYLDRSRCVGERMSSKGTTTDKKKKAKGTFLENGEKYQRALFGEWSTGSKGTDGELNNKMGQRAQVEMHELKGHE
jgi:hypothetical protein